MRFHESTVLEPWLRVLFITSMWPDDVQPHYGIFVKTQAQSLEARQIGVDVLAIRGYASRRAYLAALVGVTRTARARDYDVVHIHTGHAAASALLGVRSPTVVSFVGGDLLGHPHAHGLTLKSRVERSVFRQLARYADATITKSHEMEMALPPSLRHRNHVVPNGVDLEAFTPRSKEESRRELGWSENEEVVLFLGNPNDPRKNAALARAAVRLAKAERPNLRLVEAFGSAPDAVPRLMWAADCLVLPSRSEGSPNVVKEAMAAALPIVATPVGDVPERLAGLDGCFVVRPRAEQFAAALKRAVVHGRSEALRVAVMPLSLEAVAGTVVRLYESVSGRREDEVRRDMAA